VSGDDPRTALTMRTERVPLTLAVVVHRAVQVADPDGSEGLDDLLQRFEDADQPLGAADEAARRIAEETAKLDPQEEDAAVQMAGAVATYLAFRRDELFDAPRSLLALAARAEFDGHPPKLVQRWLTERGVEL
jgi:hypothetical protein